MIHVVVTQLAEKIFHPMDVVDLEYGKAVALMLADWKIGVLTERVTTGEFGRNCKIFVEAVKTVQRAGRRPTFNTMRNRKRPMRNWQPRESAEVIEILAKRGDIVIDESKQPTAYYLPKKVKK